VGFQRLELRIISKIRGFVPLHTADALVLRTYKLGEADRIVVFLTRDRGKKRGVAKGARRHRSRFIGALEPLTEVRIAYFESERRELVGLNYAEIVRSPLSLVGPSAASRGPAEGGRHVDAARGPADAGRDGDGAGDQAEPGRSIDTGGALGYVSYFAELLDEWAQDADADERLYRLGASMLDALSAGTPVEPLGRYFEYWLLRLQGVYPEARGNLSAGAMAFLAGSRVVSPQRIGDVPADGRVLRELENVHRSLIATHLEKTLKSDRVLRDLRRHG
jgi:DNA repair protein RecO (recombination protein O)